MKRYLLLLLAVAMCLGAVVGRADGENLIVNGSFEELNGDGFPIGWSKDMYVWDDGITYMDSVSDGAYAGAYAGRLRNMSDNDARFSQIVAVEPNSIYLLSGYVRAENCGADGLGANLSIASVFTHTAEVKQSDDWTYVQEYGLTGPKQTSLTVYARLGFYSAMNSGTAWFDDISLVKVNALPAGVSADLFYREDTQADKAESVDDAASATGGIDIDYRFAICAVCALFAALYAFLLVQREKHILPDLTYKKHFTISLWIMLALALALRLALAFNIEGYPNDIACWQGWGGRMASEGSWNFYSGDGFCDYPPGYMLVLGLFGLIRNLFNLSGTASAVLFKLPPIICDLAGAVLIYKWVKSALNENAGLWLATLYAFAPAVFFDSAAWGQIDSVLTLLLIISIYYASRGNWKVSIPVYVFSVLVKPQALMLGPVALAMVVMEIVWAKDKKAAALPVSAVLEETKSDGAKETLASKLAKAKAKLAEAAPKRTELSRGELLRQLGIALLISLGVIAVVVIPFWGGQSATWLFELYGSTLSSYNYAAVNALNVFSLLGKNWADATLPAGPLTLGGWGVLMMVLTFAYALFLFIRSRKRETVPMLCGMVLMLLFAFGSKMHERYMYPAIALFVLGYLFIKDKRLLYSAAAVTLTQFVNMALVLHDLHLISQNDFLNGVFSVINIAAALYTAYVCFDICVLSHVHKYRDARALADVGARRSGIDSTLDAPGKSVRIDKNEKIRERIFTPGDHKLHMGIKDYVVVGVVTVVYAFIAFTNLGTTSAPQTTWQSTMPDETVVFDLGQSRTFNLTYYCNICNTSFYVSTSEDGVTWNEEALAMYDQGEVFRWLWYSPQTRGDDGEFISLESGYPPQTGRYVRLRAESIGLKIMEVGFLDADGVPYPVESVTSSGGEPTMISDPALLVDEQDTVPAKPSYLNSTIFDEIYHARTAYEHLHNLHTYEWTHPPLGKVLMMIGIQLFGMSAFGWRFMGTLFGVLMLPAMYLLAKQLFKRLDLAAVAMVAFTFDFMHFTQTRLATIDTYGVFFIIIMYIFMFRYLQMSFFRDGLKKTLIPLGLCGIFMGLGMASKWIDIYAGGGLAVLFFASLFFRVQEYMFACKRIPLEKREVRAKYVDIKNKFLPDLIITLLFCCVFFIAIPLLIYYFSYYWQLRPDGGLSVKAVWDVQKNIFNYHSGLTNDTHPFSAKWYTWPLILKPMYYYSARMLEAGQKSIIWAMGNPAVWWISLFTTIATAVLAMMEKGRDKRKLIVLASLLAQYLPWVLVPRSMYIYHYFASIPFIILCTLFIFEALSQHYPRAVRIAEIAYCAVVIALFALFYPVISGAVTSVEWVSFLSNLGPWNIY